MFSAIYFEYLFEAITLQKIKSVLSLLSLPASLTLRLSGLMFSSHQLSCLAGDQPLRAAHVEQGNLRISTLLEFAPEINGL